MCVYNVFYVLWHAIMVEKLTHSVVGSEVSPWLRAVNSDAYMSRYPLNQSKDRRFINEARIIDKVSGNIISKILDFEEVKKEGRKGVVLAIAHRGDFYIAPVAVRYGTIDTNDSEYGKKVSKYTDYALFKAHFLVQHPNFYASSQNFSLEDAKKWKIGETTLPGGAIAFKNGVILSMSGLSTGEKDTAAVLAIGVAAHLVRPQVAVKMAKHAGSLEEYQKTILALQS